MDDPFPAKITFSFLFHFFKDVRELFILEHSRGMDPECSHYAVPETMYGPEELFPRGDRDA